MNFSKSVGVYKTEGIILRAIPLGEMDLLLTVYTRGYGKISARAISARKKESKLKGFLQPFTYSEFYLAKSKTIDIIIEIQPLDSFSKLHQSLGSLAYAFYFAELSDKLIYGPERDEKVWRLLKRVFEVLDQKCSDLSRIKELFENKLLEFLGHPLPKERGKSTELQKLNYLQALTGERINSIRFLNYSK